MNQITVNGQTRALVDRLDVATLVREVTGHDGPTGVAVAVNGNVVRRGAWRDTELRAGDEIEVLHAVAGG